MPEVLGKTDLTIPEALEILKKRAAEGELSELQTRALTYLEAFAKCSAENAKRLVEELVERGVEKEYAIMVVNIAPQTVDELRTILAGSSKTFTSEELAEIAELVAKYCGSSE